MRYISFSEFYTFYNDRDKYYLSYILGIQEPPSKPMMFGSIIHKMIEDKTFDYHKAIDEAGFTSDYKRIADKVKDNAPSFLEHEKKLFIETDDFGIFAIIDGVEKDNLVEIKTGASFWTQERADDSDQITMYSLAWKLKYKELKPFKLISINSKNGKIKEFETSRTEEQIDNFYNRLKILKKELQELDWWDKKCKSVDRIQL